MKKKGSKIVLGNIRILILDHILAVNNVPVHGPGLNIVESLKSLGVRSVDYFAHCLKGESKSFFLRYKTGSTQTAFVGARLKFIPPPISFIYGVLYSFLKFCFSRHEICVTINPLNFVAGFLLRSCGRVGKLIAYSADYSDRRFDSRWLNRVYHALDLFMLKKADQIWSVSSSIDQLRQKQGVPEFKRYHIPNSPVLSLFKPLDFGEIERRKIVYVLGGSIKESDLKEKHHFDWLFESFARLSKKYEDAKLAIIGRGDFWKMFESAAEQSSERLKIEFLDIEKRGELVSLLCSSAVGVAFYNLEGADHLKYGDSMKIREYFAAGLPVVTTPGHSVASEVELHRLGFVVSDVDGCVKALDSLLGNDDIYIPMRVRVLEYARKTDKSGMIMKALEKLSEDN